MTNGDAVGQVLDHIYDGDIPYDVKFAAATVLAMFDTDIDMDAEYVGPTPARVILEARGVALYLARDRHPSGGMS